MFEEEPKTISEVAGKRTARRMIRIPDVHSPAAVPRDDPVESSVDGPTPSVGYGGSHRTLPSLSTCNQPVHAPPNTSRSGDTSGSSSWFGTLRRMFRRSRVAPLQTKPPHTLVPTPPQASLPQGRTTLPAVGKPSTSNCCWGNGRGTTTNTWTPRSKNVSTTVKSSKSPTKKGHPVLRPNRVAPVADHAGTCIPLRGLAMHKTTAVGDLKRLGESSEATLSKKQRMDGIIQVCSSMTMELILVRGLETPLLELFFHPAPARLPPTLLARLANLFTCCIARKSCQPPGKSWAIEPPPPRLTTDDDEDRELGKTTTAAASRPRGKEIGCCPCARPATVAPTPGTPPPMFWVGSRYDDDSDATDTSEGDIMGIVLPTGRVNSLQAQEYKNLKTIAHKQTVATEEDIRKTTEQLWDSKRSKPQSKQSQRLGDEDKLFGIPSIDEKNLRPVSKELGCPVILGRGQSGIVRLMRLRRPEGVSSLVAIKRLMLGSCSGPHPSMIKEIRALQAVEHCSIFPKLVGVITKQSFAQEFIGNPKSMVTLSVFKALRGKPPISVEHWVLIIHDVITGISALHQSGWAHCDLQSNNVLLWRNRSQSDPTEARWQGRIIDLGNAKRLTGPDRYCLDLTPLEKEAYYRDCRHIPVEIVEGLVPYGVRSDIYSLGVLMKDIAHQAPGMFELVPLADTCTVANPDERPTLRALLKELNVWCRDHTGYRFSPVVEKKWVVAYV